MIRRAAKRNSDRWPVVFTYANELVGARFGGNFRSLVSPWPTYRKCITKSTALIVVPGQLEAQSRRRGRCRDYAVVLFQYRLLPISDAEARTAGVGVPIVPGILPVTNLGAIQPHHVRSAES